MPATSKSVESEHDKDAGHSIDWASIESASRLSCESPEKICGGRAPSIGKEWSYIAPTSEPARKLENHLLSCKKLEAINIHSRRPAMNYTSPHCMDQFWKGRLRITANVTDEGSRLCALSLRSFQEFVGCWKIVLCKMFELCRWLVDLTSFAICASSLIIHLVRLPPTPPTQIKESKNADRS